MKNPVCDYRDGAIEMKIRAIDTLNRLRDRLPVVSNQEGRYHLSVAIRALQRLELPEKPKEG